MVWLVSSDYDRLATLYGWFPIEALSVLAAIACGAEIITAAERCGVRTGIQQAVASLFSIAVALWLGGRGWFGVFVTVREVTWIWLFLAVAGALAFAWLKPVGLDPLLFRHACIFAVLMGAHAFIAPMLSWGGAPTWVKAQLGYRAVAIGCCVAWMRTEEM